MSKSLRVDFDLAKREFKVWLREWYFQGDRPDYTLLGTIPLTQIAQAIEDALKR